MQTSIGSPGMPAHVTARLLTTSCSAQIKWAPVIQMSSTCSLSHNPPAGSHCKLPLFQDGAFMVRKSSGQDAQQPYTLVVFYNGRVYNIPIRFIPTTQQYALGREKRGEEVKCRTCLSFLLCLIVTVACAWWLNGVCSCLWFFFF